MLHFCGEIRLNHWYRCAAEWHTEPVIQAIYETLALNAIFVDSLVWFEFWEEATELMFVGAVAFALWRFKAFLEKTPLLALLRSR